jgi:ribosome-associated protein
MTTKHPTAAQLRNIVKKILDDNKGIDIKVLDVRKLTSITDYMVICSGTSTRHVKALADHVIVKAKAQHAMPLSVEGQQTCEWILVDLIDVVVHIMLPAAREFYNLEKLWSSHA